jgi:hypothetical protein
VEFLFGISGAEGNLKQKEVEGDKKEVEIEPEDTIRDKWVFVFPLHLFSFRASFRGGTERAGF